MIVKTQFSSVKEIEIAKFSADNEQMGKADLIIHTRPNGEKVAILEDVFTEMQFRRQGVATTIVEEAIRTAKNLGAYKLVLMCTDENTNFYSRFGFQVCQNAMRLNLG
jgi:predicted N-acetyltransferase YhbS